MRLTLEQQKLVEENHNLIYWYIHMRHLDINEYYDVMAIELCNSALKYNPERGSFSNFFKLRADWVMQKEYRSNQSQKRQHKRGEFHDNLKDMTYEHDMVDSIRLQELMEGEYGEIVKLRYEGYSQQEIAEMIGTNQSKVSKMLKAVKEEYMKGDNVD